MDSGELDFHDYLQNLFQGVRNLNTLTYLNSCSNGSGTGNFVFFSKICFLKEKNLSSTSLN